MILKQDFACSAVLGGLLGWLAGVTVMVAPAGAEAAAEVTGSNTVP
jgi:hypothetical protein